mgnify:CR=1 FL=1
MFLLAGCATPPPTVDHIADAERHVAWVERTDLDAQGVGFTLDGTDYDLTLYQAGPWGTVKATVNVAGDESTLTIRQWLERGVPCYAEFTEHIGGEQRGARIWLSDGDRVELLKGYQTVAGELPAVDPGELPIWATQLTAHTLKELDALCQQTDADCTLSVR